jgi:hypothetical protein
LVSERLRPILVISTVSQCSSGLQNSFDFRSRFKLTFLGNHAPAISIRDHLVKIGLAHRAVRLVTLDLFAIEIPVTDCSHLPAPSIFCGQCSRLAHRRRRSSSLDAITAALGAEMQHEFRELQLFRGRLHEQFRVSTLRSGAGSLSFRLTIGPPSLIRASTKLLRGRCREFCGGCCAVRSLVRAWLDCAQGSHRRHHGRKSSNHGAGARCGGPSERPDSRRLRARGSGR